MATKLVITFDGAQKWKCGDQKLKNGLLKMKRVGDQKWKGQVIKNEMCGRLKMKKWVTKTEKASDPKWKGRQPRMEKLVIENEKNQWSKF
jgi:hypothetical protein